MQMHMISDYRAAVATAWQRHEELLEAARLSGDPDDHEAARDAYLDAIDITGEANEMGEL